MVLSLLIFAESPYKREKQKQICSALANLFAVKANFLKEAILTICIFLYHSLAKALSLILLFAYKKNIESEFLRILLWFQEVKLCAWIGPRMIVIFLVYKKIKDKKALVLISHGHKMHQFAWLDSFSVS